MAENDQPASSRPPWITGSPQVNPSSRPARKRETSPPWYVVIENDPVNLMSYVVLVLRKVFGYSYEKARRHMLEVHLRGHSMVWSGDRESAELYTHQLQQWQLNAHLEENP